MWMLFKVYAYTQKMVYEYVFDTIFFYVTVRKCYFPTIPHKDRFKFTGCYIISFTKPFQIIFCCWFC